ncbi:MAG TPA: hypothetical protein VNX00_07470 [Herbaspirillum sp.]|nr:hypothetical protein [Herbaspirillum sp.]
MTKTPLLSCALLLTALLSTACSTPKPDGPLATDQLVFQVCLRDPSMAKTKQLDFTIVRADKRDIAPAMAVGASVKKQAIFEAVADNFSTIKMTVLSTDRLNWYGFTPPADTNLTTWTDWQAATYVSRSEDIAYKQQHDLNFDKKTDDNDTRAIQIRYRMMHYKDILATRAMRRIELPHTDFAPC